MDPSPEHYDEIVAMYIRVIKQDSVDAAIAIQEILSLCGSRAALRATLAMTLLKIEVQQHHVPPDMSLYAYMFHDYPQALPLLEVAMKCWLYDRSIRDVKLSIPHPKNEKD